LIHFSGECPRSEDSEYAVTIVRNTNEFDASFEYDEDTVLIVASIEQGFAGLGVAPGAK
jgi:hypothetical protein